MSTVEEFGPNYGPASMIFAWFFFGFTYVLFEKITPSKCRKNEFLTWRWKNMCNTFLHSVIAGIGALICFYRNPKLAEDVVDHFADSSHLLYSFSLGYFLFDFVDLMIHNPRHSQTYELVIHHVAVSSCFFISMVFRKYVGYATAALVIEMSNICLHSRQLLHLSGVSRDSKIFRINSLLNVVNFIIFRIMMLAVMTHWIVIYRNKVPTVHYIIGTLSTFTIIGISIYIFYRLITSDFYPKKTVNVNGNNSSKVFGDFSVKKSA